ncbi:MAG: protein tyrosine phosphatase [Hyphomicrobium sp.]
MQPKPSASIHVCALRHIPEVLQRTGAKHLVSAINADLAPVTPAGLNADRHLKLDMHDIIEHCDGARAPAEEHVGRLIEFVSAWDRQAPLLIHCYAGLSRSTAAAFIALCTLNPEAPEQLIAQALRRASDTAVPNRRFVGLADDFLGRRGRMLAALEAMGPNRIAAECIPFGVGGHHGPGPAERTDRAA